MCGIAGILTTGFQQNSLETYIQRMQVALAHRGPDDRGIYFSKNRQVTLAHTRLSILDLSVAGHQPMSLANGRYWITFNGEIYNFQELRQALITQGEQFESQTDTEVILKLYQQFGVDCIYRLRGMYAFAIWDEWEQTCFLVRDPLGIKPLYYWQSGSNLVFASELKAILATRLVSAELSQQGLYGYFMGGSVPEPLTLIEGVYCLPAGHWLQWQAGKIQQQQYWQINFGSQKISDLDAIALAREALLNSIQHHLISDVPVGIFLSGGIDSSAVLALASQTNHHPLHTYSIAFEEPGWNEGEIAKGIARMFGAKHTECKLTATLAKELLPQFLAAMDQPSIDGFNTFCVVKVAHDHGVKVVLSGLGGDELFAGYQSFKQVPQMVLRGQQFQRLHPIGTWLGKGLARWKMPPKIKRLSDFLQQPPTSPSAYQSFRGIFAHTEACQLLSLYLPACQPIPQCSIPALPDALPTIADEVSFLELSYYMRNQLLRDSDVMSMAWGLELRVPLVDQALLNTLSKIPSNIRLAFGKQLLIQAVPELPNWLSDRPKRGFSFPFEQWMAHEWRDYFQNVPNLKHIPLQPWYRRWSLAMLQHWLDRLAL
jgi:asparagine synthase (glutamine-hydrolysing)